MGKRSSRKERRRRARAIAVVLMLLVLMGALVAANAFVASLPSVAHLTEENPTETSFMEAKGPKRAQQWVPLGAISPELVRAVLLGEDAAFYHHGGFDPHEIKEAFKRNWAAGKTVRGASTITQQLAKNLFLSSEKTYTRKLKEAVLTYRLERALTKDRILEIYLNVIEWGDGIYGAEAAARDLYRRSAASLDHTQAATMAAMIPNPVRFHPCRSPKALRSRRDRILRLMAATGDLSEIQLETALKRSPLVANCGAARG